MIKKYGKAILCKALERQVLRLREKYGFQIIAVAGSVGKTSTKTAIAKSLTSRLKVRYQEGNYNDRLTVPLVVFGHAEPNIFNIPAWLRILKENERIIRDGFEYDVVVLELGTDGPGQLKDFDYLAPDVTVLTAIAAEHMEYFGTLDTVAAEELAVLWPAKRALLNLDDIDPKYLPETEYTSYGIRTAADYRVTQQSARQLAGQELKIMLEGRDVLDVAIKLPGDQGAKIATAAVAVMHMLGWTNQEIKESVHELTPFAGRMQVLEGIKHATILDDTYNASPVAVKAALDVVYAAPSPQRIAILGTMNELGSDSPAAHREVGAYCDPKKLDIVVTIGNDAETYLAPAAEAAGCHVVSFSSPYAAAKFVSNELHDGALVLAKGSQNGVFAEEAIKPLLLRPSDAVKLVRQSAYWLRVKRSQFPGEA
jgi:UDP-N-acetylmuramoyl-tripeptide--D-alanyl-D-alanine ligase